MPLGVNLRQVFKGANNTQIAEALDVSPAAVGHYINQDRVPERAVLIKIHEKTGCSLNWLLFDEGPIYVRDLAGYAVEDLLTQLLTRLAELPDVERHWTVLKIFLEVSGKIKSEGLLNSVIVLGDASAVAPINEASSGTNVASETSITDAGTQIVRRPAESYTSEHHARGKQRKRK